MKKVLFALLLMVVALAVLPIFLPKNLYVEKEYILDAPVEQVYTHFNDLKKFTKFDAWSSKDSAIILKFSSPFFGEGASYKWQSEDKEVGEGSMTISEARLNEFITYNLNFGEVKGNSSEVIFQRLDDDKTRVIWSFDSVEANYPFQIFNLLMKGTVKNNLERSLENLNCILQKPAQLDYANQDVEIGGFQIVEQGPKKLFGVIQQTSINDEEIGTAMSESFGLVRSYLVDASNLSDEEIGKPTVIWKQYDQEKNAALFYCGYIVNQTVAEVDDLEFTDIPGGKFLTTFHNGGFNTLEATYKRMRNFAEVQNIELSTETYDVYYSDAETTEESEMRIQVFIQILN